MGGPLDLPRLDGSERFSASDLTVRDFWGWALGDLRMNTARGLLAEFLVARALGATQPFRIEWAAYDVETPEGVRVEVKSSGYFQSWGQERPSTPRFALTGAKEVWDPVIGKYLAGEERRPDVWVFALQSCQESTVYDPLDIAQWQFHVAADESVRGLGQKSAVLSTIERLAGPAVPWTGLTAALEHVR